MHTARRLAPRWWPTWLALGALRCTVLLPYRWQMGIGRGLGHVLRLILHERRHIARTNLALCFPHSDRPSRNALLRRHFESLGMGIVETALSWWGPERRLRGLARIEGIEHLQRALEAGCGVILLSGHFTSLEIGGRLLSLHVPFHVMYRGYKNPVLDRIMERARRRLFGKAIPRSDIRAMIRSLRQNTPVWYAPDQDYGRAHSVHVPFFGVPAATITVTSRIARASGAPVVPFFPERLPHGGGYRLRLLPALEDFPGRDETSDARRLNALIEEQVKRVPDQYLWVHRRFKTQPEGKGLWYRGERSSLP